MDSRRLASTVGALMGAGAVGCGGGDGDVNTGNLESDLKPQIEERLGVAVKAVDCPERVPAREGGRFECRFTALAGESDVVPVVQRGGELSYQLPPVR